VSMYIFSQSNLPQVRSELDHVKVTRDQTVLKDTAVGDVDALALVGHNWIVG
jgi:hypothetical protein